MATSLIPIINSSTMKHLKILRSISIAALLLLLVIVGVQSLSMSTATALAATVASDVEAAAAASSDDDDNTNERTCSLDPSATSNGDCSATTDEETKTSLSDSHRHVLVGNQQPKVIPLTDDNFDTLTHTSSPSTWLIMFKTNSCGICKKAFPILEALSKDKDIIRHNCRNEVDYGDDGVCNREKIVVDSSVPRSMQQQEASAAAASDGGDGEIPKGPIYIATIDAGWSGRDTSKRFEVDATPTIIILRNEGYTTSTGNIKEPRTNIDTRSYYVYRGQRATYPLRSFVLGGYEVRKQMTMPPPLSDDERKPISTLGRMYEYIISPSAKWAGGILVKIVLAWFVFIGVLGLFMRIHNYAWGGDDDGGHDDANEIEKEKARGREEYNAMTDDEKIERRQQMMWERKEKNRAMFAAKREARDKANRKEEVDADDDEPLEGVGIAVKKSDTKKILRELKNKKDASKSNDD